MINLCEFRSFMGHPVDYILQCDITSSVIFTWNKGKHVKNKESFKIYTNEIVLQVVSPFKGSFE